jgi:hypothetical protein
VKTVNVNLKKKTIQNAIGQLDMLTQMDLSAHRKGDPIYELVMEVKRDIKRQMRKPKINVWKEFFDFWPLSICVPAIFIIYMWGLFNY